jgi:aryl-alcohol dehydrogenase-like predicted oxidoreductase
MKYRRLGSSESEISEIGFGAKGIGGNQGQGSDDDESIRALLKAFELGVNFVDTALSYGDGHSEKLVGQALKQAFSRIFVATKIPPKNYVRSASAHVPIHEVFPHNYIVECTEQSLRNLGAEQIYLQQFQVWTDAWATTEEWRRASEDLVSSGKVRFMGILVSEHEPDSALEAVRSGVINAVQVVYNIFDQSAETNLFPLCKEHKVGVLARAPLDEGGMIGDKPQLLDQVTALQADLKNVPGTFAEIALEFCLSNDAVSSVIPDVQNVNSVESSARASSAGSLDAATLALLKKRALPRNFYE